MHIFAQNTNYCLFNGFLHGSTGWLFFVKQLILIAITIIGVFVLGNVSTQIIPRMYIVYKITMKQDEKC